MMQPSHDVEGLLRREQRAALPLARQFHLYLNPFLLFKDASHGSRFARACALSYNRAIRAILLRYLRRWGLVTIVLFLGITPAQWIAAHGAESIIPAATLAIGTSLGLAVIAVIAAVYLLLGMQPE